MAATADLGCANYKIPVVEDSSQGTVYFLMMLKSRRQRASKSEKILFLWCSRAHLLELKNFFQITNYWFMVGKYLIYQ